MKTSREYELLAMGWDAAVDALVYEDGTPVELARNLNPFWDKVVEAIEREKQTRTKNP